jgi:prephenate dehydrogenase
MVGRFSVELTMLTAAIERGDGETILDTFERAKAARDSYCETNS